MSTATDSYRAKREATGQLSLPHPIQVLAADALTALVTLEEQSIHSVITSPPYWGLRDYGLEPLVWAPVEYAPMTGLPEIRYPEEANPRAFGSCNHLWGVRHEHHETREAITAGKSRTTDRCYEKDESRRFNGAHHTHVDGQFCQRCGAWRGALGLEPTPELYIGHLIQVFRAVHRVLRDDGTLWLNLGDRYSANRGYQAPNTSKCVTKRSTAQGGGRLQSRVAPGLKRKDLVGIPWRAALALQADGWYLRSDVVWAKGVSFALDGSAGNAMPEAVTDRPVRGHEFIFLLAKRERYFYDHFAVQEDAVTKPQRRLTPRHGARDAAMRSDKVYPYQLIDIPGRQQPRRNLRDVWRINTQPFKAAHFAVFPPNLVCPMVAASTPQGGVCPQCGTPYRRQILRAKLAATRPPGAKSHRTGGIFSEQRWDRAGMSHRKVSEWLAENPLRSEGWLPGCRCDVGTPVPAVVLDPFAGAGTVGLVALQECRRAVLIEPSPEYREIIAHRLGLAPHNGPALRQGIAPRQGLPGAPTRETDCRKPVLKTGPVPENCPDSGPPVLKTGPLGSRNDPEELP